MIKNLIISYIRSLLRNKTTSFINIFGLAIGLASCFIIMLFVISEIRMDHFQKNRKNVYRVITENKNHNMTWPQASFLFGPTAKAEFPEIKSFARIIYLGTVKIKKDNQLIEEEGFHFADPSVFNLLSFQFLEGKASDAISQANTIAVSQSIARKYFGKENAIGQSLMISIKGEEQILTITSVFADLPLSSSVNFSAIGNLDFGKRNLLKMLITYSSGEEQHPQEWKDAWDHILYTNLIQIPEKTDIKALEAKINKAFKKYQPKEDNFQYSFQRYDKIYLHSSNIINDNSWKQGKLNNIYVFSATALLILIIACFNYLILSLAQSEKRAREIGIRKASGAGFNSLRNQVLLESIIVSYIALPIAIGLTELILPILNSLLEKNLVIHYTQNLWFILGVFIITIVISLASGFYLAFYLNKFNPIEILRGSTVRSGVRSVFLKSLVIIQISIFIALIISSAVLFKQLAFVTGYHPGIDTQNVLTIRVNDVLAQQNYPAFRQELEKIPEIKSVGACLFLPPTNSRMSIQMKRIDDPSKPAVLDAMLVDYNLIETLGLTIIEGRSFSRDFPSDAGGVVINESAIQELGLKETIGTKLPFGTVIGVVKDFHIHDLHSKITPAYLIINPQFFEVAVKTRTDATLVIPKIKALWSKLNPDTRFECDLFSSKIEAQYQSERRLSKIILIFTIIAILIATMGLFGLSHFITQIRTKEIGIRKVNGGTLLQMILLLWKEILIWTIIAFIVACPVAWYFMNRWLENFAYQTGLSWWIFAMAGITALFIALLAVSWQSYRVANRNPVKALRYE